MKLRVHPKRASERNLVKNGNKSSVEISKSPGVTEVEQQKPAKTRTKAVSDSFLKVANLKDIKVNIQDSNPKPISKLLFQISRKRKRNDSSASEECHLNHCKIQMCAVQRINKSVGSQVDQKYPI